MIENKTIDLHSTNAGLQGFRTFVVPAQGTKPTSGRLTGPERLAFLVPSSEARSP